MEARAAALVITVFLAGCASTPAAPTTTATTAPAPSGHYEPFHFSFNATMGYFFCAQTQAAGCTGLLVVGHEQQAFLAEAGFEPSRIEATLSWQSVDPTLDHLRFIISSGEKCDLGPRCVRSTGSTTSMEGPSPLLLTVPKLNISGPGILVGVDTAHDSPGGVGYQTAGYQLMAGQVVRIVGAAYP